MKSPFFSTFSALIAIAIIIPADSLANTPTAKVPSVQQQHQVLAVEGRNNDKLAPGAKQVRTTIPVGGLSDDFPYYPRGQNDTISPDRGGNIVPFSDPADPEIPPVVSRPQDEESFPVVAITLFYNVRRGDSAGILRQYTNYKTWGGSNWTASIDSPGEFTHKQEGASVSHTDSIINYISWDGQPWTATFNSTTNVFTHTRQGSSSSHTDTILNYVGWDGSQWTMQLQ
ncbi:MAG: DUF4751 family protein [Cyanobacteria bacterium J06581_3]